LEDKEKKQYLQCRKPKWIFPSNEKYNFVLQEIEEWSNANRDKEVLSLQLFSGNGVVSNGRQNILLN
jgi:hypothetical protein